MALVSVLKCNYFYWVFVPTTKLHHSVLTRRKSSVYCLKKMKKKNRLLKNCEQLPFARLVN